MDHSIKKKPEKPRMRYWHAGERWTCQSGGHWIAAQTGTEAYQLWQRTRAALNKHEGK